MADESKKTVSSKASETEDKSKAAEKVAKAAKSSPAKAKKNGPSAGSRIKKFFKDFKGESKKIVWPDAKTVFKSTGVVLLVVIICALIIYGIDQGLSAGVQGLKGLAEKTETTAVEDTSEEGSETTAAEAEETTEASEETSAEETTKEKKTTKAETTEEKTTAEKTTAEETTAATTAKK